MGTGLQCRGGRFFYNDQPVFISSIDCETLVADTRFDLYGMLDLFVRHGFNKIRLWGHSWMGVWTGPPEVFMRPWKPVPGPGGWCGMRWDLDQWNDAYWNRMRDFCEAALERNFIVEISLFAEWVKDFPHPFHVRDIPSHYWWRDELFRPEWNSKFNVNGAFTTNANDDFWPEFFDLNHSERSTSGKTLQDYQQAYIDKVIEEFDEFPNVYYELFNEFVPFGQQKDEVAGNIQVADWQNHWAEYLKTHSQRMVGVHAHQIGWQQSGAIGVENFQSKPFIDILNFHWYGDDPLVIANTARPLHQFGKPLANNEGEWHGVTGPALDDDAWATRITRSNWGQFMAGSHNSYTEFPPEAGNPRWIKSAERFKALRTIAGSMKFAELQPVDEKNELFDSLITQGPAKHWRLIANPGQEYLAYFWYEGSAKSVRIALPEGEYHFEWYDTRNARNLLVGDAEKTGEDFTIGSPPLTVWDENAGVALVIRRKEA